MTNNQQNFSDKIFSAIIIIFLLKVVYILFHSSHFGIGGVIMAILSSLIVFLILALIARSHNNSFNSRGGFGGSGSNVVLKQSLFDKIQQKYRDLAQKYIDEKNYRQASYVYFKLLNDKYSAAQALEDGNLHNEAALIYLKHLQDKSRAAECFEKGKSYSQAIKLYSELEKTEKVGDLHLLMNNKTEARKCYLKVIDNYKEHHQYVKASLIYRNKINDSTEAQTLLLDGWRTNRDAYNCLNNYFENIHDLSELNKQISSIYQNETNEANKVTFLQILKHEYNKDESLKEVTKDIAYEIIAAKLETNKEISSELIHFNKENTGITKDVIRFKTHSKKKN